MSTVTTPHILIVNDDREVQAFFRDLLEDEGYRVTTQTITAVDLTAIGQLAPDVIVFDAMWLTTPEWDVLQGLAAKPQTRAIPIVLCTIPVMNSGTLQDRLGGLAVRVVNKPYTLDDVLAAITEVLPETA